MRNYWLRLHRGKDIGDYATALYGLKMLEKHFAKDHPQAKQLRYSHGWGTKAKTLRGRLKTILQTRHKPMNYRNFWRNR